VTEAVLDASVVLKWFGRREERHADAARAVRSAFEDGVLVVLAPRMLGLEVLNVAGRAWGWTGRSLAAISSLLEQLRFEVVEPDLRRVPAWVARGLTAYDAVYAAGAEAPARRS
jgi:predicted nucleic acid-binding protein